MNAQVYSPIVAADMQDGPCICGTGPLHGLWRPVKGRIAWVSETWGGVRYPGTLLLKRARLFTPGRPQCSQVAACPWLEPPAGPRRRTEEEALQRRIDGAQTPSQGQGGPAGAALLWTHVHLTDSMSVAHLSHVFAP